MACSWRARALIVAGLILAFAIIHLGVGIAIAKRYDQYADVFRQSVALAIYNIVIGVLGLVVVIVSVVACLREDPRLKWISAICSFVLGVLALVSLIVALALNAQAIGYIKGRLSYRISSYSSDEGSIEIVDAIQTKYECCGQNLWFDWRQIALGAVGSVVTAPQSDGNSSSDSQVDAGKASVLTQMAGRLRRQQVPSAMRSKRDLNSISAIYGLPVNYTINLPLSCCKEGGTAAPNTLGGYCVLNSNSTMNSFYVRGCLEPISNTVVSQITGIAVINVCLMILAFVFAMILVHTSASNANGDDKQALQSGAQPLAELQVAPYGGYATGAAVPNTAYGYAPATNAAPVYGPGTYTVCL